MADISTITLPSGTTYNLKDAWARTQIQAITGGSAIVFKGVSSTAITDGGNENPTVDGTVVTAKSTGDLYFYEYEEFIYGDDSKWHSLGPQMTLFGDLAYFYDLNAMGNRHIGNNLRIMVINNGRGMEFRNYIHQASVFGEDTDAYIAAAGHYGKQSPKLLKHYAEDLGFEYISASDKMSFEKSVVTFLNEYNSKSIFFEVFTQCEDENQALYEICHLKQLDGKQKVKNEVRKIIGEKGVSLLKKVIKN